MQVKAWWLLGCREICAGEGSGLASEGFLPGRRPQGREQHSSQDRTSTSTSSRTRTFRLCLQERSKMTGPSETGGQALRTQCINGPFQNHSPLRNRGAKHCVHNAKKELDRGPLTTPKPPLAVYCPSETTAPSETRGPTISEGASIISQALRPHCKDELDRGPLTTPKPPLAPPLAPPTPAENGGPSEIAVRSDTGGQSPRLHSACGYVITLFLPRFYPIFTPLLPPVG